MNQALKDLWKKNFPLWPDALFEKFSEQIQIEANAFSADYGKSEKKFYTDSIAAMPREIIYSDVSYNWRGSFSALNPGNQQFRKSEEWGPGNQSIFSTLRPAGFSLFGPNLTSAVNPNCFFVWDSRIFGNVLNANWLIDYEITGGNYSYSYMSFMSYDSMTVQPVRPLMKFIFSNAAAGYAQSKSLIALYENGVQMPEIDYAKLYEFNTYLDAYKNYSQQISGSLDVAKKQAQADLQNYKADLDSKLLAQKNALQNLTLQLTTQTQAQADSARRDMQQLNLQAISFKLQILGLMKK